MEGLFDDLGIDIQSINIISLILRLCIATICGGLIGLERERKNRAAGLRTHMLVCIGSALAMSTNQYVMQMFGGENADPTRIGAQVISGIGFLGAGTIMITGKQQIKGLTTAAGLWASACMGLAIGIGFYEGAIVGCIFILIVVGGLQKLDSILYKKSYIMNIYIEVSTIKECRGVITYLRRHCAKIYMFELNKNKIEDTIGILCSVKLNQNRNESVILEGLQVLEGVEFVEEVG